MSNWPDINPFAPIKDNYSRSLSSLSSVISYGLSSVHASSNIPTLFITDGVSGSNPLIGITGGTQVSMPTYYQTISVQDLSAGSVDVSGTVVASNIAATSATILNLNCATLNASLGVVTSGVQIADTTITAVGGSVYANSVLIGATTTTNTFGSGVSSLSTVVSYGLSSVQTALEGLSSLSTVVSYGLSSLRLNSGVSSLSTVLSYGLSSVRCDPGLSSLSSIVSYGLSSVASSYSVPNLALVSRGLSTLSSIVSYGLSSVASSYSVTNPALVSRGLSSLSSIVSYGLSSVASGPSVTDFITLQSLVSFGLSSVASPTEIHLKKCNATMTSDVVYGTGAPPPQPPSDLITPFSLEYAQSLSVSTYFYSNVTTIDNYNVTVVDGIAYYTVDVGNCYGCAFSNQIISDWGYASALVIVAGWYGSFGFFDVYNGGNIPITFQSEFYNELGPNAIPAYTNSRAIFQGADADPPILIEPITTAGLSVGTTNSSYINSTYVTQSPSETILTIDLSGSDAYGNPIGGEGTLGINASVDLRGNTIQGVAQLNTDSIVPAFHGSLNVGANVEMNYNNINDAQQISIDYISPSINGQVDFLGTNVVNINSLNSVGSIGLASVPGLVGGTLTTNELNQPCFNGAPLNSGTQFAYESFTTVTIADDSGISQIVLKDESIQQSVAVSGVFKIDLCPNATSTGSQFYVIVNHSVHFIAQDGTELAASYPSTHAKLNALSYTYDDSTGGIYPVYSYSIPFAFSMPVTPDGYVGSAMTVQLYISQNLVLGGGTTQLIGWTLNYSSGIPTPAVTTY